MKRWKYQRLFGFYNFSKNQYWVKVNERLNSVFRNSAWWCWRGNQQLSLDSAHLAPNICNVKCLLSVVKSLGELQHSLGLEIITMLKLSFSKQFECFQETLYNFLPEACKLTQNNNACNQERIKNASTKPPSYQSAGEIYELQAQQERLLKLLSQS